MTSMNPARELHQIISNWQSTPGTDADTQRGLDDSVRLAEHFRAIHCIEDCRQILEIAERESPQPPALHKALDAASLVVFHYPYSWANTKTTVDETTLSTLSILPNLIDEWQGNLRLPMQSLQARAPEVREQVSAFKDAVSEDETLPGYFKRHVARLANHIIGIIDNLENGGTFNLTEALDELLVYIHHAQTNGDDSTKKSAGSFGGLLHDILTSGAGGFLGSLGTAAAQMMFPPA